MAVGIRRLEPWVQQGVLLLNTFLTVEEGKAASHAKWGWQTLTCQILKAVLEANPTVVFLVWGKMAAAACKEAGISAANIVEAAHLSASKGFFDSQPFSKANTKLADPIQWTI